MASKAAQKGLKYEPVEKIPDGGAERRGCNFWTSLSPDFSWADDFLHSRLAQIGRLDCLSPERHALEIGRGSCRDAFSSPTRVSGCGNAGAVHLLIIHHRWIVHADQRHLAICGFLMQMDNGADMLTSLTPLTWLTSLIAGLTPTTKNL